jgi:hypothetical protein
MTGENMSDDGLTESLARGLDDITHGRLTRRDDLIGRGETMTEYEDRITREHIAKVTSPTLEQHRQATENAPTIRLPR